MIQSVAESLNSVVSSFKIQEKENTMADNKNKSVEKTKESVPPKPPAVEELSESDVEKVAGGVGQAMSPHNKE